MIDMNQIFLRLSSNAEAIRALAGSLSDEQAEWKPGPDIWSMKEVMAHVYNEERVDFRQHLKEILDNPQQPWGGLHQEWLSVASCSQALEYFLKERQVSIAWIKTLPATDWDTTISATFGPQNEILVLSAGDILASWVEHDYLHLRQMIEVLHAWNEKQSTPYSLDYAGGW
jgi:hypothetical protein